MRMIRAEKFPESLLCFWEPCSVRMWFAQRSVRNILPGVQCLATYDPPNFRGC